MLESDTSPDVNTSEIQCLKPDTIASQAKRWDATDRFTKHAQPQILNFEFQM